MYYKIEKIYLTILWFIRIDLYYLSESISMLCHHKCPKLIDLNSG